MDCPLKVRNAIIQEIFTLAMNRYSGAVYELPVFFQLHGSSAAISGVQGLPISLGFVITATLGGFSSRDYRSICYFCSSGYCSDVSRRRYVVSKV